MKHRRKSSIFIVAICLLCLLVTLILTMPLNRILTPQLKSVKAENVLISIIEPVSLYSGRGFIQIKALAPIWAVEYRLCGILSWCVTLTSGANQLHAQASFVDLSLHSGLNLKEVEFVGNSDVLHDTAIKSLSAFEITAQADNLVLRDFNCPFRSLSANASSINLSQITVLGEPLGNITIDIEDESSESLIAIFKGSVRGAVSLQASTYQAELSVADMPAALVNTLTKNIPEFSNVGDWSLSGALPCTSSYRASI